ncbi:MAG: hypothetical protein ACLP22_00095 [Solirubrobacteraceae bacterium]
MRRRLSMLIAFVAALGVGGAADGALATSLGAQVKCTSQLTSETPASLRSGYDLGFIKCDSPFGNGLQYTTYRNTVNAPGSVAAPATSTFKSYYDAGTTHGTVKFNSTFNPKTSSFVLHGSVTILGGTGTYKNAAGSGPITCTSRDDGQHVSCDDTLSITRL